MATNTSIPQIDSQIGSLQSSIDKYSGLGSSGAGAPSSSEIAQQQQLLRLRKQLVALSDEKLKARWYPKTQASGATQEAPEGVDPGILGRTIDVLQTPVRGVVGAVKHVTGQGTPGASFGQDVMKNISSEKELFGDVLTRTGMPGWFSKPLGFALDIALDPMNWAMVGTEAMVPKIAYGLKMGAKAKGLAGAVEGASLGAKASLAEKGATMMNLASTIKPAIKETSAYRNLGTSALHLAEKYDTLTGKTLADVVKPSWHSTISPTMEGVQSGIKDFAGNILGKDRAESIGSAFAYRPGKSLLEKQVRKKDLAAIPTTSFKNFLPGIQKEIKAAREIGNRPLEEHWILEGSRDLKRRIAEEKAMNLANTVADASGNKITIHPVSPIDNAKHTLSAGKAIISNPKLAIPATVDDSIKQMAQDNLDMAGRAMGTNGDDEQIILDIIRTKAKKEGLETRGTGIAWYDDKMEKLRNWKVQVGSKDGQKRIINAGEKLLDGYETVMTYFKNFKVPGTLSAWYNATIGNVTNTAMTGVDIGSIKFVKRLSQSANAYGGKLGSAAEIQKDIYLAGGEELVSQLRDNPVILRDLFGDLAANIIPGARLQTVDELAKSFYNNFPKDLRGKTFTEADGTIRSYTMADAKRIASGLRRQENITKVLPPGVRPPDAGFASGLSEAIKKMNEGGGKFIPASERATGMVSQEFLGSKKSQEIMRNIANKAELEGGFWNKFKDFTMNRMASGYESIDQSFKLTLFLNAILDGFTRGELSKISNFIKLEPEMLIPVVEGGITRYRLPVDKAAELTAMTYMNYAAMPGAVQVLRSVPLLGAPFASFTYGMFHKTGQTLMNNPAVFSNIAMGMSEFGGQKTPMERAALYDPSSPSYKYYSYLGKPGMYRLPGEFFDQYPVYVNMANALPYYSMSLLAPSQTMFPNGGLPEKIVEGLQKMPFMKDPAGQFIINNVFQPMILSEGVQPVGAFGQPLYPSDAGFAKKAAYALRDTGEAFVPGYAALAGIPAGMAGMSGSAAELAPLYRFRQLANATQGLNQYGISGKESAASRSIRALLASVGPSVQAPMNIAYQQK